MFKENIDLGRLILRVTVGGLMLFHGMKKLIDGHDFIRHLLAKAGLPEWLWLGVPLGEVIAPLCLIVGVFTRSSALLVAFTMAMSIALFHGASGFALGKYGALNAELNLFYLLAALSIFYLGSGKFSLSNRLLKGKLRHF